MVLVVLCGQILFGFFIDFFIPDPFRSSPMRFEFCQVFSFIQTQSDIIREELTHYDNKKDVKNTFAFTIGLVSGDFFCNRNRDFQLICHRSSHGLWKRSNRALLRICGDKLHIHSIFRALSRDMYRYSQQLNYKSFLNLRI